MPGSFLTAEWRQLAMLNFVVEPELLLPFVPAGTELDRWDGKTFLGLVGFLFANTRVLGIPVPFHRTFEEVNLRFYVRRNIAGESRRAVTFIREIVPRRLVAAVARLAYNEPYVALPMRHHYAERRGAGPPPVVEYTWRLPTGWAAVRVEPLCSGRPAAPGSEEEFITEHYWGYTRQRDGSTVEYRVTHPSWRIWSVGAASVTGDLESLYGARFGAALSQPPASAFLAEGSAVAVARPERLAPG